MFYEDKNIVVQNSLTLYTFVLWLPKWYLMKIIIRLTSEFVDEILKVWQFKWKLLSNTFLRYFLLCRTRRWFYIFKWKCFGSTFLWCCLLRWARWFYQNFESGDQAGNPKSVAIQISEGYPWHLLVFLICGSDLNYVCEWKSRGCPRWGSKTGFLNPAIPLLSESSSRSRLIKFSKGHLLLKSRIR